MNSSVKKDHYDYTPNKLKITGTSFLPDTSLPNANQYNLEVSYVVSYWYIFYIIAFIFFNNQIPELYQCTGLINKYIEAQMFTCNEEDSQIHPNFKFIIGEKMVDSRCVLVDKFASRLEIG